MTTVLFESGFAGLIVSELSIGLTFEFDLWNVSQDLKFLLNEVRLYLFIYQICNTYTLLVVNYSFSIVSYVHN